MKCFWCDSNSDGYDRYFVCSGDIVFCIRKNGKLQGAYYQLCHAHKDKLVIEQDWINKYETRNLK